MANQGNIEKAYDLARERYSEFGVDAAKAIERLAAIPISLHCWQGDDVGGFESAGGACRDRRRCRRRRSGPRAR